MEQKIYNEYVEILKEELLPAMGCTEPIAVAYAAAVAVQALGEKPESVEVNVSANIIKNVKSVVVPCTGGLRGIGAAVCAGIVAGCPEKELEILEEITGEQKVEMKKMLDTMPMTIRERIYFRHPDQGMCRRTQRIRRDRRFSHQCDLCKER